MAIVLNTLTDRPASYIDDLNENKSSNLVRLVEDPEIEKTIRFDEMSLPDVPDPKDVQGGNTKVDQLGLEYPMIRINDMILARQHISSMKISLNGFVPTISLKLMFEDTNFLSKNMPKDGDMISLYVRTDTEALSYLRDDFIITSCSGKNAARGEMGSTVTLSGRLFIPGFDSKITINVLTGSSRSVIRQIAEIYGIGFSFNDYEDTDDFMNWIQCRENMESFISKIVRHSWKDETSFFKCWVDLYYDLCYVNVNKFLLSTENEEEIDITFASGILNMYNQIENDPSPGKAKMTVKILTNMSEFRHTPFYITKWNPTNNSSSVSLSSGYSTTSFTYVHNQNIINQSDSDCFETLTNIPAYDPKKTDSYIILRGRAKYEAGRNPENEQARVNYDYIGTYNNTEWTGVEYVMSDDDKTKESNLWSGNVHKNYNRAPYHNNQNLSELNKIYLDVWCDGLNLQIMRGERVPLFLLFNNTIENDTYNHATENDTDRGSNRFYSGFYIVDSVEYVYKPIDGDRSSVYQTHFVLKRREWPTPEIIKKDDNAQ